MRMPGSHFGGYRLLHTAPRATVEGSGRGWNLGEGSSVEEGPISRQGLEGRVTSEGGEGQTFPRG